jgi:hypothetical protein
MGKITEKVIKETYGVDSITINGCILIPFYQVIDKLNRLAKIEQIVNEWNNDASNSFGDMCKIKGILGEDKDND